MEIKANNNVDVAQRVIVNQTKPRPAAPETDTASFSQVDTLDQSLRATPPIRSDVVNRAKELVANVKYPPIAAIEGIAALLALKLDPNAEA